MLKPALAATTALCAAAFASLALAQSPAVGALPSTPIDPARLSQHIKVLSSDAFEGRGPATPAEEKATGYIIDQFKAVGLEPGGPGGSWIQPVPLGRFEIKGPVTAAFLMGGVKLPLSQGAEIAVRAAQRPMSHVSVKDSPVVFAGYGVTAPELGWDDYKGLDVRGKTVVVLINDPDFEAQAGEAVAGKFGGKAMTYYGRWTYKCEEAARRGAAALLIVHETAPASYGWNTVKNSNTNVQFDVVRDDPAKVHVPVEAWIQRDVAATLMSKAGIDFDQAKAAARRADFKAMALKGATFSAEFDNDARQITSKNVAGKLTGTKRPDETILYTAHWDHLGVGQPDARGDRIYNGAVDNADGIAALIELGRTFAAAPRTARTVVFLAVTAEEKGLLGSEYYAGHPLYPLAKTVADINIDALSASGPAKNVTTSGSGKVTLEDDLAAAAKAEGRYFSPDPTTEAGHFYRSDHFPLAKRGVPAMSVGSGDDLYAGGKAAGDAAEKDYVTNRYHQPGDEWRADWDLRGQAIDVGLFYRVGRALADSDRWPEWKPGTEFKALRDTTTAQRR